jgi:hypothetical protein
MRLPAFGGTIDSLGENILGMTDGLSDEPIGVFIDAKPSSI